MNLTERKMILLLGATGYIGSEFGRQMHNRDWYVDCRSHVGFERAQVVSAYTAVISCAAYVTKPSVELCEDHKADCLLGNLLFPTVIRDACAAAGVPLLHVSTGCLYNGDGPFKESDPPMLTFDTGAGFYVGSKELAERLVRQYYKTWICRVRLPFDQYDHPRNFLSKLLSFPKVLDTRNSMSHRGDFVKACLDLIELKAPFGTYNMTNPGAVWTHDIVDMLKQRPGLFKTDWEYWDLVEFILQVRRTPMSNAELDVSKLLATGVKIRPVMEAMEDSIKNWTKE